MLVKNTRVDTATSLQITQQLQQMMLSTAPVATFQTPTVIPEMTTLAATASSLPMTAAPLNSLVNNLVKFGLLGKGPVVKSESAQSLLIIRMDDVPFIRLTTEDLAM
jgi:hypothetical protein